MLYNVKLLSQDTPITPCTQPRTHLPIFTAICASCHSLQQSTVFHGNLLFSTAICCFLWQSAVSTKFCQVYGILLNSTRTVIIYSIIPINLATMLIIYTLFSLFFTFFLYIMSWSHYIVHIYSLLISTSLYIIVVYTHSVTAFY